MRSVASVRLLTSDSLSRELVEQRAAYQKPDEETSARVGRVFLAEGNTSQRKPSPLGAVLPRNGSATRDGYASENRKAREQRLQALRFFFSVVTPLSSPPAHYKMIALLIEML
jgi:hypothetical protein